MAGRPAGIYEPVALALLLAAYAYDDLGRRASLTRGNGTVTSYAYDGASRLTQIAHDLSGTTYDQTLAMSYDPAGGIVGRAGSNDLYAWGGHYAVNRNYTANGLNQYTASGAVTPTYDARGNVASAGGAGYDYTAENRLAHGPAGAAFVYDPLGRLYYSYATALGSTYLFPSGDTLIAELDSGVAILRRYVFGPGGEPLVQYEGSGTSTRRYFHADERGSVVAVSDGSGAMYAIDSYDEYGIPGSANQGRFQYTGQAWLPELGMYYYRNRIYSPTLGRFMQTDPIGFEGGMNIYAYTSNDPVNFADPSGLVPEGLTNDPPPKCTGDATRVSLNNFASNERALSGANEPATPPAPPRQPPNPPARRAVCAAVAVLGGGAVAQALADYPILAWEAAATLEGGEVGSFAGPGGAAVGVIIGAILGFATYEATSPGNNRPDSPVAARWRGG